DEAHHHGLIHRDLKPANVMISRRGKREHATILDFGLARAIAADDEPGTRVTASDVLLGTPRYIAPEQIQAASEVGPSADLYALGGIIYTMLRGVPPFQGTTPELIDAHLRKEPEPLPESGGLGKLALDLLQKNPSSRPHSGAEVIDRVEA